MTVTADTLRVSLEVGCSDACDEFAGPLLLQLQRGQYETCSVLRLPDTVARWRAGHRTARKRADRAARRGYYAGRIIRHQYADDIHAINTSLTERQGRRMADGYWRRPSDTPDPVYRCARHGVHSYGVLLDDTLVAYAWIYRAGDLALVSSILGHGDHLDNEIMYLLSETVISGEAPLGGFLVYNRHDSGTDGLRFFKERLGFEATAVEWIP